MQIALLQINPTVGALRSNSDLLIQEIKKATKNGAEIIVSPELVLSGYPPEDLILKDHFCSDCEKELARIIDRIPKEPLIFIGTPLLRSEKKRNAAVVINNGKIIGEYYKHLLPNYSVFDEKRLFVPGNEPLIIDYNNNKIAVHICEDSWDSTGIAVKNINKPIDMLINLSASPYHRGKQINRFNILKETAQKLQANLLYCNLVGGQDELVFDGSSMMISATGKLKYRAESFKSDILYCNQNDNSISPQLDETQEIYEALKLGLHDYVIKTGFKKVLIALSGGIDSALVLALAADALGQEKVICVTMPSIYSSKETLNDALEMAKKLGIEIHNIPIKTLHNQFQEQLLPMWSNNKSKSLTDENIQARIRGNLIMAISNEYNWLVLTTGNKSEIAMGYCTLYGDMCGGFALIKDVPKTIVFDLCKWRNTQSEIIPPSIISRPPSAELRPDQKDIDTLPPYDQLDPILEAYIEQDMGINSLTEAGFEPQLVEHVINAVEISEYKRRQSPPGVKITPRSFDKDRRMPIVNKYRN